MLETERLILRVPTQGDFDAGWAEFHGDAECMRYLGGAMPRSIAWRTLAQVVGMWPLRRLRDLLADREGHRPLGRPLGPLAARGLASALEVGWMLHRSAWGQGYATEAAEAALRFVFEDLGWPSVAHMIHPENLGSQAVAALNRLAASEDGDLAAADGCGGADPDVGPDGGGLAGGSWPADAAGLHLTTLRVVVRPRRGRKVIGHPLPLRGGAPQARRGEYGD
ncbi:GNAT family N-acetyltransferase [Caulobacter segnis]